LGSGELMAMYGSSSYHIRVGTDPIVDPALWAAPFVFPGTSVLAAGTSTAGTATRWAADLLGLAGDDETVFTALLALAQDAPSGSDGVMFLPHLAGERTPVQDPDSRGVLAGLGLAHGRRHVARAVLEGIAHSVVHALSAYDAAGADLSTITAVGGLTRNPVVMRAVSAMTGLDQRVAATSGASFGDAMLGALAVGALPDRDAARAWVTYREPVTAVADDRLTADHRDYVRLYEAMAPWQHRRRGA
ncbi:MAG: sugar kinase, partial [Cellulomonas sp.]|nr:sugar kinase [Cellulomonas sp.]